MPSSEQTVAAWSRLLNTSSGGASTIDLVQSFEALSGGVSSTPVQVLMGSREAWGCCLDIALMALSERGVTSLPPLPQVKPTLAAPPGSPSLDVSGQEDKTGRGQN